MLELEAGVQFFLWSTVPFVSFLSRKNGRQFMQLEEERERGRAEGELTRALLRVMRRSEMVQACIPCGKKNNPLGHGLSSISKTGK